MSTIDFARIRSTPKSKNDCFEALAVHLFRNSYTAHPDAAFISLRGDGGDGGVEAYFRSPAGDVTGIQAKYFFKLGSSEMGQIADSLKTAQNNHPGLSEYWVYIPFDLTGKVAEGKRGKSEAERFEVWKQEVENSAKSLGSNLTVTLCTASIIRGQLLATDPSGGMRRYWFDDSTLTRIQIEQCLNEAAAFAGPRYTAALDVVTNAHTGLDFFGGIGDFEEWHDEKLAPVVLELRSLMGWGDEAFEVLGERDAAVTRELMEQTVSTCERMTDISIIASDSVKVSRNLTTALPLLTKAREAQEKLFYEKYGIEKDTPGFRQFNAEYMCTFPAGHMDAARKWEEKVVILQAILASSEMSAATTRSLLLIGPAGIGKTHSIVSAAYRRLDKGGSSLVVFGDDFGKGEPWEIIRSKLGFGADIKRETLFACLQACAENTGFAFVVYIDALNESSRDTRWKRKLPELLTQCAPYAGIKICVSTRDTYKDLVVDAKFPGYAFEHIGFVGHEFEAIQTFAKYYGLDSEITPLFAPELGNPLFLHLACKTLRDEGRTSLDVSLPGFVALFEGHLKHCDNLVRDRLAYTNPQNVVRAAMLRLSDVLTHSLPQERTWQVCITELKALIGNEITPESLLTELEHEGLVILSAGKHDTWFVRLGYQRYGDILRAMSLVERLTKPEGLNILALASKLTELTSDDEGLLEALAVVLPERTGIEITDKTLGLDVAAAHRLFIRALIWRSRDSITDDIDSHVYNALHTTGLWKETYNVFFTLSLIPQHRLNSSNWLSPFLQQSSMVNRDAFLSIAALESFDEKRAIWSLINAALRAEIQHWPEDSRYLAAVALAWLTSCADRRIRDLSAKALARLVAYQPNLGRELTYEFQYCDDEYVLESIALAIYSACLLARDRAEEFAPALEGLLSPTFDVPNILVRDSVRLLAQVIGTENLSFPTLQRLNAFPSKTTMPTSWPTMVDAKPLLDLEALPLNMKLIGDSMEPDFWRYQARGLIEKFDLDNAGITHENIACWMMVQVCQLGYPGAKQCALNTDRFLDNKFGNGRARKGYADRLGKKYYWILLHRLIGLLADNIPPKTSYTDWTPAPMHLWSIGVRKSDLTDVRDIVQSSQYPDELLQGPRYLFPDRSENIKNWVGADDFTRHEDCIVRISSDGTEWVTLSMEARDNDKKPSENSWGDHLGLQLAYKSIFVDNDVLVSGSGSKVVDAFENLGASCYRAYLAEYPDGLVFEQLEQEGYLDKGPEGMTSSQMDLLRGAEWEYDYSFTTTERQERLTLPCQDLLTILKLKWDKQRGFVDSEGTLIAFDAMAKRRHGLFIRRDALNTYLTVAKRKLFYQRFVTRGFYTGGGSDGSQIDIWTWLYYEPSASPKVLKEKRNPFNC